MLTDPLGRGRFYFGLWWHGECCRYVVMVYMGLSAALAWQLAITIGTFPRIKFFGPSGDALSRPHQSGALERNTNCIYLFSVFEFDMVIYDYLYVIRTFRVSSKT